MDGVKYGVSVFRKKDEMHDKDKGAAVSVVGFPSVGGEHTTVTARDKDREIKIERLKEREKDPDGRSAGVPKCYSSVPLTGKRARRKREAVPVSENVRRQRERAMSG